MGYQEVGSIVPDNLIGGTEVPLLTAGVTLLTTQGILVKGSVIGVITASGKGLLCDKNSSDGSEVGKFILTEDVDTDSGDIMSVCYKSGIFNQDALTYGTNGAPTTIGSQLRDVGIHLKAEYPIS